MKCNDRACRGKASKKGCQIGGSNDELLRSFQVGQRMESEKIMDVLLLALCEKNVSRPYVEAK